VRVRVRTGSGPCQGRCDTVSRWGGDPGKQESCQVGMFPRQGGVAWEAGLLARWLQEKAVLQGRNSIVTQGTRDAGVTGVWQKCNRIPPSPHCPGPPREAGPKAGAPFARVTFSPASI
jgi:hypothetical protein